MITFASHSTPDSWHVVTGEGTPDARCTCMAAMFGQDCWAVARAAEIVQRERELHARASAALRKDRTVESVFESATAFKPETLAKLKAPLDPKRVLAIPDGPAKGSPYLPGYDVIETANAIFGYGNWGFELVSPPWAERGEGKDGKPYTVWLAMGRVYIRGGFTFTDLGSNQQSGPGAAAVEMSAKGAVTDSLKRCLMHYGDQFGLVLHDKDTNRAELEREFAEASGETRAPESNGAKPPLRDRLDGTPWTELTAGMKELRLSPNQVKPYLGGEFSAKALSLYLSTPKALTVGQLLTLIDVNRAAEQQEAQR